MRITFICGCLEPGKDGVGDYVRKLAGYLIKQNQEINALALNDKYIDEEIEETQEIDDTVLKVFRVPSNIEWNKRLALSKAWIAKTRPDWISLQYVPYSFHRKGLPYSFNKIIVKLTAGYNVHVMMHELWVGEELHTDLRRTVLGLVQKRLTLLLLKAIMPRVINTSIPLYNEMLINCGFKSAVLPIFSNITYTNGVVQDQEVLNNIPDSLKSHRNDYIIGCIFGSLYSDCWDLSSLMSLLNSRGERSGKKIAICSIGNMSSGKALWQLFPQKYPFIDFFTLGKKSESFVSFWLTSFTDFGIITTPPMIAGKSGAFLAFKEHGLLAYSNLNKIKLKFDFKYKPDSSLVEVRKDTMFPLSKINRIEILAQTAHQLIYSFKNSQI